MAIMRDGRAEYQGQEYECGGLRRQARRGGKQKKRELARQARISMDQAIQIAISKTPERSECSSCSRWSGPASWPSPEVLYHVVILRETKQTRLLRDGQRPTEQS